MLPEHGELKYDEACRCARRRARYAAAAEPVLLVLDTSVAKKELKALKGGELLGERARPGTSGS